MSIQIGTHHNISRNNQRLNIYSDVQSNLLEIISSCNQASILLDKIQIGSSNNSSNLVIDIPSQSHFLHIGREYSTIHTSNIYVEGDFTIGSNLNISSNMRISGITKSVGLITSNSAIYSNNSSITPFIIKSNAIDILSLQSDKNNLLISTNVGIGTSITSQKLYVEGDIYVSNDVYISSINSNAGSSNITVYGNMNVQGSVSSFAGFNFGSLNSDFAGITILNENCNLYPSIQIEQRSGYQPLTVINIKDVLSSNVNIYGISSSGRTYIGKNMSNIAETYAYEQVFPSMLTISLPYTYSNNALMKGIDSNNSLFYISEKAYIGIGTYTAYHPLHISMQSNTTMNSLSNIASIGIYHENVVEDKNFMIGYSNSHTVFLINSTGSINIGSNNIYISSDDGNILANGNLINSGNISSDHTIITSNIFVYNSFISLSRNTNLTLFDRLESEFMVTSNLMTSNIITSNLNISKLLQTSNIKGDTIVVLQNTSTSNLYLEGSLSGPFINTFSGINTNTEFIPSSTGTNSITYIESSNVLMSINNNYQTELIGSSQGNSNGILQIRTYSMQNPISVGISVYGYERSSIFVVADTPYYQLRSPESTYNLMMNTNNEFQIGLSNNNIQSDYTSSLLKIVSDQNGYRTILGNNKTRFYVAQNGGIFITTGTQYDPVLSQTSGGFEVKGYANFRSYSSNTMLYMDPRSITGSVGIGTSIPRKTLDIIGETIVSRNIGIGTTVPRSALDINGSLIISQSIGIGTTLPQATLHVINDVILSNNIGIGTDIYRGKLNVRGNSIFRNGNIGIGTTTPRAFLHINYPGSDLEILRIDNNTLPYNVSLLIRNDGNVGMGTAIPRETVDIVGNMIVSSNIGIGTTISSYAPLYINRDNSIFMNGNIGIGTTVPLAVMHIQNMGGTMDLLQMNKGPFIIKNNGNIGIGTTIPRVALDVINDVILSNNIGIGTDIYRGKLNVRGNSIFRNGNIGVGTTTPRAFLHIHYPGSDLEILRIDNNILPYNVSLLIRNDGNVGMGTAIPREILDIVGNMIVSSNIGIGTTISSYAPLYINRDNSIFMNGNIGIGTTVPLAVMHIQNMGGTMDLLQMNKGPFIIKNNGNIGIGTTIPRVALDIVGNAIVSKNIGIGTTIPLDRLHVSEDTIISNGNLGIGTETPISKLHIRGSGNASLNINTTTNQGATIAIQDTGNSIGNGGMIMIGAGQKYFASIKGSVSDTNNSTSGDLVISTRNSTSDSTLTPCITIKNNGNIGIGTTLPVASLHISDYKNMDVEGEVCARNFRPAFIGSWLPKMFSMPNGSTNYVDVSTAGNTNVTGFYGGFTDGRYAYLVPYQNESSSYHGILTRIDTQNYTTSGITYLDVSTGGNTRAKGFIGGFTDGRYAYLVPSLSGSTSYHGILTRVDLQNFEKTSSISYLDVSLGNTRAKGFAGGFTDGRYAYLVPFYNGTYHGILTRIDTQNYNTTNSVSYLDVSTGGNTRAKGFNGGFTDGCYAYLVPYQNGTTSYHGILTRVDLQNFEKTSSISYLDVSTGGNTRAKGFIGGFTDGRYAYLVPSQSGLFSYNGIFTRVDLQNYNTTNSVSYLDVSTGGNTSAKGFAGGFTDGRYAYLVPYLNGSSFYGILTRVDLQNYTTTGVRYLDVTTAGNTDARGFRGGFTDGRYAYLVPYQTNYTNSYNGILTRVLISNIYPQGL